MFSTALKEKNVFIMSAFSEDITWWLISVCARARMCMCMCDFFSPNKNEDRKTALLNLLSVKGFLGIFSMCRKITKSRRNFCQAAEVTDSSHTPLGLVNSYQRFRGDSSCLSTLEKEATRARAKKTNIGMHNSYRMSVILSRTIKEA